jgi:prevent-host-death family protein
MVTIKATFVRNHIAETWEMARNGPVVVENHGQPEFVILTASEYEKLSSKRKPRQPGFGAHLFEGIDVDELLATPIPGIEEYMPE